MTNKSKINVSINRHHECVKLAQEKLVKCNAPIYQMGANLVYPFKKIIELDAGDNIECLYLATYNEDSLLLQLGKHLHWTAYNSEKKDKNVNPNRLMSKLILSNRADWSFKEISGVSNCPTIRPNGTMVLKEGYDKETKFLFNNFPKMPAIPKSPTKDDALKAIEHLEELVEEFSFEGDESKSVALSILMTPVLRNKFDVVPMHCVNASTPGSGKSYLIDMASCIALGHKLPVFSAGRNEEETEKRLFAALISGQNMISIDNCNGDLSGDALCQVIERSKLSVRILGKSEIAEIDNKSTLFTIVI